MCVLVFFSWQCLIFDNLKGTGDNILYSFFAWTGWIHAKTCPDWHANVPLLQKSSITQPAEFVMTKFGKLDILVNMLKFYFFLQAQQLQVGQQSMPKGKKRSESWSNTNDISESFCAHQVLSQNE
jgi:nitric oxide reductase large subunit